MTGLIMGEIILIGLIIGIIFYELTDISPGGLVVPGMIAYYIYTPERILMTIIISIITHLLMLIVQKYTIIYGKRKFVVHILLATILSLLVSLVGGWLDINFLLIPIVGYIIPGLVSNEMSKQGMFKTLIALLIVSGLVSLMVLLL